MTIGTFSDELEAALRYDQQAARLGKAVNFPEEGTTQKKATKWGSASAAALASPRSSFLQTNESLSSESSGNRGKKRRAKPEDQGHAKITPSSMLAVPATAATTTSAYSTSSEAILFEEKDGRVVSVCYDMTRADGHERRARIQLGGVRRIIGSFGSREEAARAYDSEAISCGMKPNFPISNQNSSSLSTNNAGSKTPTIGVYEDCLPTAPQHGSGTSSKGRVKLGSSSVLMAASLSARLHACHLLVCFY